MSAIVYGITKPPACTYYDEKNNSGVRCQCLRDDDLCCLHNEETRKKLYSASWNEQYAMCPIKEIPTPHGRLIDADKLIKFIQDGINKEHDSFGYDGVEILTEVQFSQTIIEAEVE